METYHPMDSSAEKDKSCYCEALQAALNETELSGVENLIRAHGFANSRLAINDFVKMVMEEIWKVDTSLEIASSFSEEMKLGVHKGMIYMNAMDFIRKGFDYTLLDEKELAKLLVYDAELERLMQVFKWSCHPSVERIKAGHMLLEVALNEIKKFNR